MIVTYHKQVAVLSQVYIVTIMIAPSALFVMSSFRNTILALVQYSRSLHIQTPVIRLLGLHVYAITCTSHNVNIQRPPCGTKMAISDKESVSYDHKLISSRG